VTRPHAAVITAASVGVVAGAAGMLVACMVTDALMRRAFDAFTVARARWELDAIDELATWWAQ